MPLSRPPADLQQILAQAIAFHRSGRLAEAEQFYQRALIAEPRHFAARHSLGILRAEQGRLAEAIELIAAALAVDPSSAPAWMNYGSVLSAAGRPDEALACYNKAVALKPSDAETIRNRGRTLRDLGRFEDALADFDALLKNRPNDLDGIKERADIYQRMSRQAEALADYDKVLARAPDDLEALNNRGNVLRAMGRPLEALASYDRALAIMPDLAESFNNRGSVLWGLGRLDEAVSSFDRALALTPDVPATLAYRALILKNRGKALYEQNRIAEGLSDLAQAAEILSRTNTTSSPTGPDIPHKVLHDEEQLHYLIQQGVSEAAVASRLHFEGGERLQTPALNPVAAKSDIAERWRTATPKIVTVDDFLTQAALAQLRRFCWGSTMWRTQFKGYLGAFPEQGFACPLLAQIAEELPDALPQIFQGHRLRYLWAFKYDGDLSGINVHADEAAVNVNFWITPDEANLDPESGGLKIWDIAAPPDWDFSQFNGEEAPIREFLARNGAKATTVPYRCNRAVIFDSDLFHETDKMAFRRGYLNRRINVTLLYGRRLVPDRP